MHEDRPHSDDLGAVAAKLAQQRPEADSDSSRPSGAMRRWPTAAIFVVGGIALFAVLVRISYNIEVTSDAANNALQAWDILHGNALLHGWIIGDATFYFFELPIFAIAEAIFGLGAVVPHVASAVVYVLVIASAVALARTGSRGMAAAIRTGIVLAILTIPLLYLNGVSLLVAKPDHTGTAAITIMSFILIEKWAERWYAALLLCLLLIAGQVGDATVLFVTVPAIVLVCAYRLVRARKMRTADGALLLAAVASTPLEMLLRSLLLHLGGYLMVAPNTRLASASMLAENFHLTVRGLVFMFGGITGARADLGLVGVVLAYAAIAASVYGFGRVIVTWTRATRAEQLLCVAIMLNIGGYLFSTLPVISNPREMVLVLPAGAVLAARGLARDSMLVRDGILAGRRAWPALAAAAVLTLVPLATAAAQPPAPQPEAPLIAFLKAHGLRYGIAGYWNASAVTLVSHGDIMVRSVARRDHGMGANDWEAKADWYFPSEHVATFAIANISRTPERLQGPNTLTVADFEQVFGKPVATQHVAGQIVMIYNKNLLDQVAPALPLPTTPGPWAHLHRSGRADPRAQLARRGS
jgi:hypothetical protein